MPAKIETFSFWVPLDPVEIAKSRTTQDPNGGGAEAMVGRIRGIASSETRDMQGEEIVQDGIDWDYCLKSGWFNWEHEKGPENVLGHPEKIERGTDALGKPATIVEGVLYLHKAKAREIYETSVAMKKAGGARRLGLSIEGYATYRDPGQKKRVLKSKVLNIAVTAHPVQPDARIEPLVRSLMASVGYQTPASGGGNLGALAPQSLEQATPSATYGTDRKGKKRMSMGELALLIRRQFPHLSFEHAERLGKQLVEGARAGLKD